MRTYVVSGSASGMGKATKSYLEAQGAHVVGVDRRDAEVIADLSTVEGRASMVEGVRAATGGVVDAVVACAGVSIRPGDPITVKVNYFGMVATLAGLQPLLAAGKDPRAVAIASMGVLHAVDDTIVAACLADDEAAAVVASEHAVAEGRGQHIYSSSKRAIARWIRRQAPTAAWAGAGIPINGIAPGVIDTPLAGLDDPGMRAAMDKWVPMPLHGWGKPEQVAPLLAWLTSPENALVTGQLVFIDGGADVVWRGDDIW